MVGVLPVFAAHIYLCVAHIWKLAHTYPARLSRAFTGHELRLKKFGRNIYLLFVYRPSQTDETDPRPFEIARLAPIPQNLPHTCM